MNLIKNIFYLIVAIFVAFIGLKFSIYGLIVDFSGSKLQTVEMSDVLKNNISNKRYIQIKNAYSFDNPLEFYDDEGYVTSYVYPLFIDSGFKHTLKTNILIETKQRITDWKNTTIAGLLKPYWFSVDEHMIDEFQGIGVQVDKDSYYLELDTKPWNWYWYLLILFVAGLFFYRMIEAIVAGIRKTKN